jgi:hypothetical protein
MPVVIIKGTKKTNINFGEFLINCPSCLTDEWTEILVCSYYFHIYYIPVFPKSKDAYVCCKKCGLKRYEVPFNAKLIRDFENVKKQFRHPWFTYTVIGAIALIIFNKSIRVTKCGKRLSTMHKIK